MRQVPTMQNRCLHGADAGKKTLKDAANAFIATSAWQVENDEDWKTFQAHAQLCHNIPRAPEVENIKELPAAELPKGFLGVD